MSFAPRSMPLVLGIAGAALVDAAAVVVASGSLRLGELPVWPAAIGTHAAAAALVVGLTIVFCRRRDSDGATTATLAILAGGFALLTPVFGALAVAALLGGFRPSKAPPAGDSGVVIGNPLRSGLPSPRPAEAPLISSLKCHDLPSLRLAGARLHGDMSLRSVRLLRRLHYHRDARTQLHAQAAIEALTERAEARLAALRDRLQRSPHSGKAHHNFASSLHQLASSGLRDPGETANLLNEAMRCLHQAITVDPTDRDSLEMLAHCHLMRGETEPLPALIDALRSLPDGADDTAADRLEVDLHSRCGAWREAARVAFHGRGCQPVDRRYFWLAPRPARPHGPRSILA